MRRPVLDLPIAVDRSVLANDRIAFNPGSLTDSIIMNVVDWRALLPTPTLVDVAAF